MKKALLVCLLACCSFTNYAQYTVYDSAIRYRMSPSFEVAMDTLIAQAAADSADTGKDNESIELMRYQYFMSSRICLDVPSGADMMAPLSTALSSYMAYFADYCPSTGFMGNWSCLGPFTNEYGGYEQQGRIVSLWVNPISHTILAGADGGGLWKSTNNGNSWHNITDGSGSNSVLGMPAVYGIAVDPLDTNTIYISLTADGQDEKGGGYSLGLAYSTDGGNTWNSDLPFAALTGIGLTSQVQKVAFMPGTEQLFVICNGRVLYKATPSSSWAEITPTTGQWFNDLQFSILNPGNMIAVSTNGSVGNLWPYSSGVFGSSISADITSLSSGYANANPIRFSLSAYDTAYIEYTVPTTPESYIFVKTPITSFIPNLLNPAFPLGITQFAISPANANIVYAANYDGSAGDAVYVSFNQGHSFSVEATSSHADGRCLYIDSASNTTNGLYDRVYVGNDGGVIEKRNGATAFASITGDSLAITQFYGFGNTDANENILAAGAQDDGEFQYVKTNPTSWTCSSSPRGDAYTTKFMVNGVLKAIGGYDNCECSAPWFLYGVTFSGSSISNFSVDTPSDISVSNINRPIYFAPNNAGYVGYSHIWKMFNGGANWAHAFSSDPIDGAASYVYPKAVADFYINDNDSANVYIVYRGTGSGTGTTPATNDTFGRLYFTKNAYPISGSPFWTNITPSVVATDNITSIAVDPDNFGRIWAAFGNVNTNYVGANPDTMKYRVWYSSDTGSTWTDVSTGLPALPVEKLLYRKGSNDEIFAGTDVGVFKWNPTTSSWQCYNNGLPTCIVMDMEFNYCANKLRVATYGRGIWESLLDTITPNAITTTTITTNTTWGQDIWLQSSVDIKAGATLTINSCTVHMPANGVITVEAGGHLIVNNATITNSCQSCFWQGIQLKGSTTLQATAANDGWATIENGSVIANATIGVTNYNSSGGIVQAIGASFIDCNNDVTLSNFINTNTSGIPVPAPCYFDDCNFILDTAYKGDHMAYPASYFVTLEGVFGVTFQGCNWLNRDTNPLDRGVGTGLYSVDGGFSIGRFCAGSSAVRSRFSGFTNAIMLSGTVLYGSSGYTTNIDHTVFDSSGVGINIADLNEVSVTEDTFNIGSGAYVIDIAGSCSETIGIYTQDVTSFRIESNIFTGTTSPGTPSSSSQNTEGAVILNTDIAGALFASDPANTIYHNTFSNLTYGAYPLGANPRLNIACNNFSANYTDIFINPDGIGDWQGMISCGDGSYPAANSFSGSVYNIQNNAAHTLYYYFSLPDSTGEVPNSTTGYVYGDYTPASDVCTPSYGVGMGTPCTLPFAPVSLSPSTLRAYQQNFLTYQQTWQDSLATEISLVDFGNTDSLINYVDTVTDTGALMATLLAASPYLSEATISEVAAIQMLSNYSMLSVMEHNPDVLRDVEFAFNVIDLTSLSSVQLNSLYYCIADSFTTRTIIQDSITNAGMETGYYANIILLGLGAPTDTTVSLPDTIAAGISTDSTSIYYMLDSNTAYTGTDSIDAWLQHIGSPWTYYARTGFYNLLQQYDIADSIMNNLPFATPLASSTLSLSRPATMSNIWSAIYNAETNGRNIYDLDSADIAALDTTSAPLYNDQASVLTLNITNIINVNTDFGTILVIPCVQPFSGSLRNANSGGANTPQSSISAIMPFTAQAAGQEFAAFPNPAGGIVTFAYNIPGAGGDVRILITNVLGAQQADLHTGNDTGTIQWNPGSLPPGIYIYEAIAATGIIATGKIVIER